MASTASLDLRAMLLAHRSQIESILRKYAANNARLFGSVARGDAHAGSDIDLIVDLRPDRGNELLRIAGISEELSSLLGVRVDVVTASLLRHEISKTALADAVSM